MMTLSEFQPTPSEVGEFQATAGAAGLVLPTGAWARWQPERALASAAKGLGLGQLVGSPDRLGFYEAAPLADPVGWEFVWASVSSEEFEDSVLACHYLAGGSEPPLCLVSVVVPVGSAGFGIASQTAFRLGMNRELLAHVGSVVAERVT